jgi:hypothetical protein
MYDECKEVDDRLEVWKKRIEGDFKQWVNELTEIPEVNPTFAIRGVLGS